MVERTRTRTRTRERERTCARVCARDISSRPLPDGLLLLGSVSFSVLRVMTPPASRPQRHLCLHERPAKSSVCACACDVRIKTQTLNFACAQCRSACISISFPLSICLLFLSLLHFVAIAHFPQTIAGNCLCSAELQALPSLIANFPQTIAGRRPRVRTSVRAAV